MESKANWRILHKICRNAFHFCIWSLLYIKNKQLREADSFLGSWYFHSYSETSLILWNRDIYYLIYNSSPLVVVVIQMNQIYMQLISLKYILIFDLHLRLDLSNGPFPSEFPSKDLYGFHFSTVYVTCSATHLPLIDPSNDTKLRENIISPLYAYSLFSYSLSSVPSITYCNWKNVVKS
jgi:hypothetical protein